MEDKSIDPIVKLILFDNQVVDMTDEPDNPIQKLFTAARFGEVKELSKSASDWDEIIGVPSTAVKTHTNVDGEPLEKAYSAMRMSRRKQNLTDFVKRSLAGGETIDSLAQYAQKHDVETAKLIREIGRELEAA